MPSFVFPNAENQKTKMDKVDILIEQINSFKEEILCRSFKGKEFLTLKEASVFLDVSESFLYKKKGQEIPYHKPSGKLIYFKKEDLINWIESSRVPLPNEFL